VTGNHENKEIMNFRFQFLPTYKTDCKTEYNRGVWGIEAFLKAFNI